MMTFLTSIVTPAVAIYLVNLAIAAVLAYPRSGLLAVIVVFQAIRPGSPCHFGFDVGSHSACAGTDLVGLPKRLRADSHFVCRSCRTTASARSGSCASKSPSGRDRAGHSPAGCSAAGVSLCIAPAKKRTARRQSRKRIALSRTAGNRTAAEGTARQSAGGRIVAACCGRAGRVGVAAGHADRRGPRRLRLSCFAALPTFAGNALARSPRSGRA